MKHSLYGLDKLNVLFITLDCCRYDTFLLAKLPFLKSIGEVKKAKTHGTFTLPAHMSFFMGYLPRVLMANKPYYNPEVRQLWRLIGGRNRPLESVGIMLEGSNILDGYSKLGFYTIGVGGVRWFQNFILQNFFQKFFYFGSDNSKSIFDTREKEEFPLNHLDKFLTDLKSQKRFFLFLNTPETHIPYDFGEGIYSREIKSVMENLRPIWGCKKINLSKVATSKEELAKLHQLQIRSLEAIDRKIETLVSFLSKPLLFVICGDHGECFGEDMHWGHGYPHQKVMEVPLMVTIIN